MLAWSVARSAADEGHLDLVQAGGLAGTLFRIAVRALGPGLGDGLTDRVVRRARAEQTPKIAPGRREEAGVEAAVGREARPGAIGAERLGHRRDDPDLARAVGVAPACGDLARVVRLDRQGRQPRLRDARAPARRDHGLH